MTKLFFEVEHIDSGRKQLLTEEQFMDFADILMSENGRDDKPQQLDHAMYIVEEYVGEHRVVVMEEAVEIQKKVKKLFPNLMP